MFSQGKGKGKGKGKSSQPVIPEPTVEEAEKVTRRLRGLDIFAGCGGNFTHVISNMLFFKT